MLLTLIPPLVYNVQQQGAVVDGTTDDISAVQAAVNTVSAAGGGWVYTPGVCAISTTLTIPAKVGLLGAGPGTGYKATAGFSGAHMALISGDSAGIRDLTLWGGPATSSSGNPAITSAIEVSAARYATLQNLHLYYVNGWSIESVGGASVNNVGSVMHAIHMEHCARGIHLKGVSGSNYVGQMFLSAIHPEVIDNGDALFLEDINDIEVSNLNGAVAGGSITGSMLHVKGTCNSCFFTNIDLGAISQSSVSPTILIETSTNGSPGNIVVAGGVVQKGSTNVSVTDGSNLLFKGITFKSANTDGVQVSGSTVASPIIFENCVFQTSNQGNGTCYDVNLTHSTGFSYIKNCHLQSPVGSGVGNVTNPANDTSHRGYFTNTHFQGSGTTPSTAFAGTPQIVRGCPGYNPRGSITPTAIGASPFTGNASQNDIQIVFTAINGMTAFKIGGTSIGSVPVVGVSYRVPARQSFEIDWTTTAPTYLWFAD